MNLIVESKVVKIDDIQPNRWNPNAMTDRHFSLLQDSIKSFGFIEAVVTLPDGTIINGEHRWRAMKEIGEKEIEVKVLDIDEDTAKLLTINLNTLHGTHDLEKQGAILNSLETSIGRDNLLDQLALSESEARKSLKQFEESEHRRLGSDEPDSDEDTEPDLRVDLGDIWKIGDHYLCCLDSSNKDDMERLYSLVKKCSLMVTDPPYGVDNQNRSERLNKIYGGDRREEKLHNDSYNATFVTTISDTFYNVKPLLRNDASFYVYSPPSIQEFVGIATALTTSGYTPRHQLAWKKNNFVLSKLDYKYQHESIIYGWGESHSWYGDDSETSVHEIKSVGSNKHHPTEKSVDAYIRLITNSSARGEQVIDPFCGSGTIFFACHQSDRIAIGIEINPIYASSILSRFEKFTGLVGVKL